MEEMLDEGKVQLRRSARQGASMRAIARQRLHLAGCAWFWAWALLGAAAALGSLSLGPLLTIPVLVVGVVIHRRRGSHGAFGLLSGIGAILLLIAYIQRSGESYDPIHWLVAGLVFLTAGVVGHAWQSASKLPSAGRNGSIRTSSSSVS
jgi:hypothetical protein